MACLGDLTSASTAVDSKDEGKPSKASGVASDGELWISKVFGAIIELEKDYKHVTPIREIDEEAKKTRKKVSTAIEQIKVFSILTFSFHFCNPSSNKLYVVYYGWS